uniref:Uncharacterized protein n=1 Tax=viral metagenome TaxID=1070528 RepID=A0A6H1ZFZ5_9ZZZZ
MSQDTMENKIVIVFTPMGLIIGRMAEGIVTSPRVFIAQKKDDELRIEFKNIIGNPELFFLGGSPYYVSESSELNELYFEAISNIKLVKAI